MSEITIYHRLSEMPIEDMLDYQFMFESFDRTENIYEFSMSDFDNDIEIEIQCFEDVVYAFHDLRGIVTFHGIKFFRMSFYNVIDEDHKELIKEYRYIPDKFEFLINYN